MKTIMSFKQFKDYTEGNKSLLDIKIENKMHKKIDEILEDRRVLGLATFVVANLLYCEKALANDVDLSKVDAAGNSLLHIVQTFGYWSCILLCILEIVKSLASKDTGNVTRTITKYVIAFGAIYFMPWLFDIIKSLFA